MENEQIGKVKLDYREYPGEDKYCDGAVEKEILSVVKKSAEVEYPGIIAEKASWPFLYHLSPIRENIAEWIPVPKDAKILEVGSGCGAITGALTKKAWRVDCVDLSRQRSLINAYRHEFSENVTIHVGNFKDIEPTLPKDYDLICLIGVFEYGEAYIGGDDPFVTFLKTLKRHMKEGGRIAIAIENKFGLKYFAGCREDHSGKLFEGIMDYPDPAPARTFTEKGLLDIAKKSGFSEDECHMYYPYPDYKFMHTLFSKERLPEEGELKDNIRNFDRDRLLLFDEKLAFENILREEQFPLFSNSYMLILGKKPEIVYARYSNDRELSKCIVTEKVVYDKTIGDGTKEGEYIVKRALTEEAIPHIKQMKENYELLKKRYEGSSLTICPCELSEDGKEIFFPVASGKRLEELLDEKVSRGDDEGFRDLFIEYFSRIGYGENESVADMDLIFSNVIVDGDRWVVIDYEWVVKEKKFAKEIAFRALYCYILEDERRNRFDAGELFTAIGITPQELAEYRLAEEAFQKNVTGGHKSLAEMRELIGNEIISASGFEKSGRSAIMGRLQVYTDEGEGFSEKKSFFPERSGEGYEIKIKGELRQLRLDPCNYPCIVRIRELSLNGEEVDVGSREFSSNGYRVNGKVFAFGTADPNFTLNFRGVDLKDENVLKASFEISPIPEGISAELPEQQGSQGLIGKLKRVVKKEKNKE